MKYFLIGFVVGILLLILFISSSQSLKSKQPIQFNHKIHKEAGIECSNCHIYFKEQKFSGMPPLSICLECHKDSITKSPEEEKLRKLFKEGKEITWEQIYKQPDHVFFSHRRHVAIGKIDCKDCHGPVGESEKPLTKPWVKMTMKWCMDCHTKAKANNDCLACHV